MTKIPWYELVRSFRLMWDEHWAYVWGAASRGKVDCSGALVYVYKQHGLKIYHGSNMQARAHVERLIPIDEALAQGLIVPGMVAFRSRKPGQSKYSLDKKYKPGGEWHNGDLNAYYHVGVVDMDTDYVLNAAGASTGFQRHPIRENWSHVARLADVDYNAEMEGADVIDVHETIRKGARSSAVASLQGLLIRRGYALTADGKFGPQTEEAVRAFQASAGLEADGVCGPLTWTALQQGLPDAEMEPEAAIAPKAWDGMSLAEKVEELHARLMALEGGGGDG